MRKLVSNFEALDATEPYDVCIVGAGIAGSVLGLRLVRAGLRVLLVESGVSRPGSRRDPRNKHLGACEVVGDTAYSPPPASRLVGGASNLWAGLCERFQRSDFDLRPYTQASNPWPLGYGELEPHYRAAERMFRVREAPTPRAGRLPPLSVRKADGTFEAWVRQHGLEAHGIAIATPASGARVFQTARELLPEFIAARNGTLVCGVTATRLRTDRNGRVVGTTCRTLDGTSKTARANTYVLAAGALDTPRLLLLSRSQRFPGGLGNDFDRVGRGFTDHAIVAVRGKIAGGWKRPWTATPRPLHTEQFHQIFRRQGLGAVHPFFYRGPRVPFAAPGSAGETSVAHAGLTARPSAGLGIVCRVEVKPSDANRLMLSPRMTDPFGDPSGRLEFNYSEEDLTLLSKTHGWLLRWLDRFGAAAVGSAGKVGWAGDMMGTCRMGADPRTSVCDGALRVHASPNLYLCGAETFPTGGAVSPALTIAALADRLADHVIARARWCARTTARPKRRMTTPAAATIPLVRRRPQP